MHVFDPELEVEAKLLIVGAKSVEFEVLAESLLVLLQDLLDFRPIQELNDLCVLLLLHEPIGFILGDVSFHLILYLLLVKLRGFCILLFLLFKHITLVNSRLDIGVELHSLFSHEFLLLLF